MFIQLESEEEDEGSVGVGKAGEKAPTWEASIDKGDESARSSSAEGSSADTSGSSEEEEADDNAIVNTPEVLGVEVDAAEEEAGSNLDQGLGVAGVAGNFGSSRRGWPGVHILVDGEELGSDEDIDWIGGNTPYGEASRGTLVHLSNKLGADDERTELFTSPDPRSCRFESNVEEWRFLASVC